MKTKTLLAVLLSFIVTQAPVLAIHGGYTLGGQASVIGTYAGVLVPTSSVTIGTGTSASNFGDNALGLFTLSVPDTGIGTGAVFIFSGANQMSGSITALPNSSTSDGIIGVIAATGEIPVASQNFNTGFGFGGFTSTQVQITGEANGGLVASVVSALNTFSPTGLNLTGTATVSITSATTSTNGLITLTPADNIVFAVDGFQQSSTASASGT
jgi:hypothetical protein